VCRVFVDGTYHGEMKASAASDADGYQYSVDDLNSGQTYDVAVKVCIHGRRDVSVERFQL